LSDVEGRKERREEGKKGVGRKEKGREGRQAGVNR
jgi:hypothetical protein